MQASLDTTEHVIRLLGRVLQLEDKSRSLTRDSALLGTIPEIDSMAVVHVLTALEEHFGIVVSDDEVSAETFATLGTLADFVESKLAA